VPDFDSGAAFGWGSIGYGGPIVGPGPQPITGPGSLGSQIIIAAGGLPAPTGGAAPPAGSEPFVSTPTPAAVSSALGEAPIGGGGWGAAGVLGDWLFRRGRPRASRYERAVRAGAKALERALITVATRIIKGPAPIIISRSRALTPYIPQAGRFAIGRVLGIGSILFPSRLDPDVAPATRNIPREQLDAWLPPIEVRAQRIGTDPRTIGGRDLSRVPIGELMKPFPVFGPAPPAPQPTPFGRRVFEAAGDFGREWLEGELERLFPVERPPTIAQAPRSAPTPTPSTPRQVNIPGPAAPPAPQPGTARRPIRFGLGAGAILAGLAIEARAPRGQPSFTSPPLPFAPEPAPLTAFSTGGAFYGGAGGGFVDECNCRPRGPRRKCLERAPVRYSGGRRKGQSAGTKCIRFASR